MHGSLLYISEWCDRPDSIITHIMCQLHYTVILIGYHTVDCTIPKYIWTSAQMTTNMIKSSGHGSKYISYCTVNCIITYKYKTTTGDELQVYVNVCSSAN